MKKIDILGKYKKIASNVENAIFWAGFVYSITLGSWTSFFLIWGASYFAKELITAYGNKKELDFEKEYVIEKLKEEEKEVKNNDEKNSNLLKNSFDLNPLLNLKKNLNLIESINLNKIPKYLGINEKQINSIQMANELLKEIENDPNKKQEVFAIKNSVKSLEAVINTKNESLIKKADDLVLDIVNEITDQIKKEKETIANEEIEKIQSTKKIITKRA